ncbi:MAG: hypothetical protein JRF02_08315, partial [Deltaproteobacteria bacterium]|nr:hypothetical protein [Deltaproteobacteria bacterium]
MQNLKINYPSINRLKTDLPLIKAGKIFIPGDNPLPKDTELSIHITLPGIEHTFCVKGLVIKAFEQTSEPQKSAQGMLLTLTEGFEDMYKKLLVEFSRNEEYKELLAAITEKQAPLSWDWILDAISQTEYEMEEVIEAEIDPPPPSKKKELTPQERERAQSVADFILNMIKAMLRSGYYDPEHPASKEAKKGLFHEFQACIGSAPEIMIGKEQIHDEVDIIITGILNEPVSVQNIVGVGRAELFVPKLNEYFNRKSLVTLAIKNKIPQAQFESFIDIMCDPRADQAQDAKVGETLTKALVGMDVTDISTVFMDDMIAIESKLPWRVEMAIQRLAKDLKVIPLFEGKTEAEIKSMKKQIVEDILRPLRHPHLLADIVINCYLIALHIEDLDAQDLEKTIIDAFPFTILLPTSRYIFNEMNKLLEDLKTYPDNKILNRRLSAVKRILKLTAKRVIKENAPGAQKFLERLYFNDLLSYDELPPNVRYRINTIKLARDIRDNTSNYINWLHEVNTSDDAFVLLKCFKRAIPVLIDHETWPTLIKITRELRNIPAENEYFRLPDLKSSLLEYIFQGCSKELTEAFIGVDLGQQEDIYDLFIALGKFGTGLLCRILEETDNNNVREAAVKILKKQGDNVKPWLYGVLDDHQKSPELHINGLIILSEVGDGD